MKVDTVFLSINAADFALLSSWWTRLIDRSWDREPMPSCHEWDLTDDVLFQVLDSPDGKGDTTVTLRVENIDVERQRLAEVGIDVPESVKIDGFESLRYAQFTDPEGNQVGLLDGA